MYVCFAIVFQVTFHQNYPQISFFSIQSCKSKKAVSPEGKQYYLSLPRPDKNLCCSPKTNTLKVSSPNRYQSHTDLWQADISWWYVIERPYMWADVVDCGPVNTLLGDWLVLTGLSLRGHCCLVSLCYHWESERLSHKTVEANQVAWGEDIVFMLDQISVSNMFWCLKKKCVS